MSEGGPPSQLVWQAGSQAASPLHRCCFASWRRRGSARPSARRAPSALPLPCPSAAVPPYCGPLRLDTDLPGSDLAGGKITGVATFAACAERCYRQLGCGALTFDSNTATCWLKRPGYTGAGTARRGVYSALLLTAPGKPNRRPCIPLHPR